MLISDYGIAVEIQTAGLQFCHNVRITWVTIIIGAQVDTSYAEVYM